MCTNIVNKSLHNLGKARLCLSTKKDLSGCSGKEDDEGKRAGVIM